METLLFYMMLALILIGAMAVLIGVGCILSPTFRQEVIDDWNR